MSPCFHATTAFSMTRASLKHFPLLAFFHFVLLNVYSFHSSYRVEMRWRELCCTKSGGGKKSVEGKRASRGEEGTSLFLA
ncbi:hypothetical protein BC939DRAFT_457989 [Gamsiella multidivaricata]|uniref:uncharacterized protein n=1 Tax=Gamsiella multidivaricata TaxID=101098 RepID=UPI002220C87A|nr:uncharacterized protein BC939DRAFT_457989 [Gamsiella multidivaricata]KAI7820440.1 hypothetical protein BC939DRAFT_457989 [Gamsiella multidivaricata]